MTLGLLLTAWGLIGAWMLVLFLADWYMRVKFYTHIAPIAMFCGISLGVLIDILYTVVWILIGSPTT